MCEDTQFGIERYGREQHEQEQDDIVFSTATAQLQMELINPVFQIANVPLSSAYWTCAHVNFHSTAILPPKACGPCTSKSARANPARLYSWSFTPLAVFFFSFQLIPPDENLVGHFKASARGLTAMDLTVPDALLVLWSLNPSLKGLLQPIYSNPLFRVQLDQKGTQCNPNDRGRLMNTGTSS